MSPELLALVESKPNITQLRQFFNPNYTTDQTKVNLVDVRDSWNDVTIQAQISDDCLVPLLRATNKKSIECLEKINFVDLGPKIKAKFQELQAQYKYQAEGDWTCSVSIELLETKFYFTNTDFMNKKAYFKSMSGKGYVFKG